MMAVVCVFDGTLLHEKRVVEVADESVADEQVVKALLASKLENPNAVVAFPHGTVTYRTSHV